MQDTRECNHSHLRACLVTLPSREGWAHKWYSLLGRSWNHASRTRTEIKTNISVSFIPFSKQDSLFNSIFLASSKALLSSHCVIFALSFWEKKQILSILKPNCKWNVWQSVRILVVLNRISKQSIHLFAKNMCTYLALSWKVNINGVLSLGGHRFHEKISS